MNMDEILTAIENHADTVFWICLFVYIFILSLKHNSD